MHSEVDFYCKPFASYSLGSLGHTDKRNVRFIRRSGFMELLLSTQGEPDIMTLRQT